MANPFTLVILHNNFGPYHVARLAAITKYGREHGTNVMGIETCLSRKEVSLDCEGSCRGVEKSYPIS